MISFHALLETRAAHDSCGVHHRQLSPWHVRAHCNRAPFSGSRILHLRAVAEPVAEPSTAPLQQNLEAEPPLTSRKRAAAPSKAPEGKDTSKDDRRNAAWKEDCIIVDKSPAGLSLTMRLLDKAETRIMGVSTDQACTYMVFKSLATANQRLSSHESSLVFLPGTRHVGGFQARAQRIPYIAPPTSYNKELRIAGGTDERSVADAIVAQVLSERRTVIQFAGAAASSVAAQALASARRNLRLKGIEISLLPQYAEDRVTVLRLHVIRRDLPPVMLQLKAGSSAPLEQVAYTLMWQQKRVELDVEEGQWPKAAALLAAVLQRYRRDVQKKAELFVLPRRGESGSMRLLVSIAHVVDRATADAAPFGVASHTDSDRLAQALALELSKAGRRSLRAWTAGALLVLLNAAITLREAQLGSGQSDIGLLLELHNIVPRQDGADAAGPDPAPSNANAASLSPDAARAAAALMAEARAADAATTNPPPPSSGSALEPLASASPSHTMTDPAVAHAAAAPVHSVAPAAASSASPSATPVTTPVATAAGAAGAGAGGIQAAVALAALSMEEEKDGGEVPALAPTPAPEEPEVGAKVLAMECSSFTVELLEAPRRRHEFEVGEADVLSSLRSLSALASVLAPNPEMRGALCLYLREGESGKLLVTVQRSRGPHLINRQQEPLRLGKRPDAYQLADAIVASVLSSNGRSLVFSSNTTAASTALTAVAAARGRLLSRYGTDLAAVPEMVREVQGAGADIAAVTTHRLHLVGVSQPSARPEAPERAQGRARAAAAAAVAAAVDQANTGPGRTWVPNPVSTPGTGAPSRAAGTGVAGTQAQEPQPAVAPAVAAQAVQETAAIIADAAAPATVTQAGEETMANNSNAAAPATVAHAVQETVAISGNAAGPATAALVAQETVAINGYVHESVAPPATDTIADLSAKQERPPLTEEQQLVRRKQRQRRWERRRVGKARARAKAGAAAVHGSSAAMVVEPAAPSS